MLKIVGPLFALVFVTSIYSSQSACRMQINDKALSKYQPLFLKVDQRVPPQPTGDYYWPDSDGFVTVPNNENLLLACNGAGNKFESIPGNYDIVEASCTGAGSFLVFPRGGGGGGGMFNIKPLNQLYCIKHPKHVVHRTNKACFLNGKVSEIGFEVEGNVYTSIEVCYDENSRHTHWAKYTLIGAIKGRTVGVNRGDWVDRADTLCDRNDPYSKTNQLIKLKEILKDDQEAERYLPNAASGLKFEYYLAKGHLAPMADFALGGIQRSTCDYINAAPQWQTMNNGNWKQLEESVRAMAAMRGRDIQVYTGTLGISKLNGKEFKIPGDIPVPAVFWKLVVDEATSQATVVISVNNPYLPSDEIEAEYKCTSDCSKIKWLKAGFAPNNKEKGYSYCCKVNTVASPTLKNIIQQLPGNPWNFGLLDKSK